MVPARPPNRAAYWLFGKWKLGFVGFGVVRRVLVGFGDGIVGIIGGYGELGGRNVVLVGLADGYVDRDVGYLFAGLCPLVGVG